MRLEPLPCARARPVAEPAVSRVIGVPVLRRAGECGARQRARLPIAVPSTRVPAGARGKDADARRTPPPGVGWVRAAEDLATALGPMALDAQGGPRGKRRAARRDPPTRARAAYPRPVGLRLSVYCVKSGHDSLDRFLVAS